MPKRAKTASASVAAAEKPAKKSKKSSVQKPSGGFREKVKVKNGVINYLFKPKDATAYNYGELEVEKDWPARQVQSVKIPPSGSPNYLPGQSVVSVNSVFECKCFVNTRIWRLF